MGVIKENVYLQQELRVSQLCRAAAHPARVKIIEHLLFDSYGCKNIELSKWLNFSLATVKNHIDMMKDAEIIDVEYFSHYYKVRLNEKGVEFARSILKK